MLDDFNRQGPEAGANWTGAVIAYDVNAQRLECIGDYCAGMFWHEEFGPVQEAFVTLAAFQPATWEINLVLKAQGNHDCDMLEILYAPDDERVLLEACWAGPGWTNLGIVNVSLTPGDELGGRARADGFVEIFKNRSLIGTFDANAYPFIDDPGRIGVSGFVPSGVTLDAWDDFGGGGE